MDDLSPTLQEKLRPFRRSAWVPRATPESAPLAGSKFAGLAFIPEGEAWPACGHCGEAMQLFAQINAQDLPPAARAAFALPPAHPGGPPGAGGARAAARPMAMLPRPGTPASRAASGPDSLAGAQAMLALRVATALAGMPDASAALASNTAAASTLRSAGPAGRGWSAATLAATGPAASATPAAAAAPGMPAAPRAGASVGQATAQAARGLLQVFYCTNDERECELECESYLPFSRATRVRVIDPTGKTPLAYAESPVRNAFAEKAIVAWEAQDDYPNWEELAEYDIEITRADSDEIDEHFDAPLPGDKLLGWPAWVQGVEYPPCPQCQQPMRLVLQIDSEDNVPHMFGDVGCAHVTQCELHPEELTIAWACC